MRTKIEFLPGTHIEDAALQLIAKAPAISDFNGIRIRAKYSTTRARDVVRQWERMMEERCSLFARSPEGIKLKNERLQRTADAQRIVDDCMETLSRVGSAMFKEPSALLSWLDRMAPASDNVDVKYDHGEIVRLFDDHGWQSNANCNAAFNGDDARNFAGWIVGQWLASKYPGVVRFIEQWRKKFSTLS